MMPNGELNNTEATIGSMEFLGKVGSFLLSFLSLVLEKRNRKEHANGRKPSDNDKTIANNYCTTTPLPKKEVYTRLPLPRS